MPVLLAVVVGAFLVLASVWLAGRALAPQLNPCLSFGAGAIALSYAIFFLMLVHRASASALVGVLVLGIVAGLLRGPNFRLSRPPLLWLVVFLPFGAWYLVNSLAPEIESDPTVYHLAPAIDSLQMSGFGKVISFYDRIPHAIEMLFVPAWRIGGSSSAKLVHFGFLVQTLPLIVYLARLLKLDDTAGFGAAALYFCAPVVGFDGAAAFNDAALVYFTVAAVTLAMDDRPWSAGLFAGFCYVVKMTGLLAVPVAMACFLLRKQKMRALYVGVAAAVVCLPWLLRNWIQTGNPFAPFLNAWFPNPYFYVLTEQILTSNLRHYGVGFWNRFPEALAGWRLQGIVGPMFVLAPLALLALRRRGGVVLLAFAAFFSISWWMNAGTRFLMPALPFLSLGLCAAIPGRTVAVVVALHAITAWPAILSLYSPQAMRLREFPLNAALRIEPEHAYLWRVSYDYRYAKMVEQNTPVDARILDLWGMNNGFARREFVASWRSAEAVRLTEGLDYARTGSEAPLLPVRANFPPREICGFRIALKSSMESPWKVHAMDVYRGDSRVTNTVERWVSSSKLHWELPLALDNNPVSRWWTGQAGLRGDYVKVEFSRSILADSVRMLVPAWYEVAPVRVEICKAGAWTAVDTQTTGAPQLNIRAAAVELLKDAGITHIVVAASKEGMGLLGERLVNEADAWNLEVVANLYGAYLLKVR